MSSKTKVITCGCRFNRFESAEIQALLEGKTHHPVVVVNTCAVTKKSEMKSRNLVRRAVRENPGADVVVAGCWAELDPRSAAEIDGVALVLGNEEKFRAAELLQGSAAEKTYTGAVNIAPGPSAVAAAPMEGRTAAYLKVQNGCGETCSFCVVRLVRGKSRSAAPDALLESARGLMDRGAKEIVLTGINIGQYGKDLPGKPGLASLVERIAAGGRARIRISSINPLDITPQLMDMLSAGKSLCPHLHIPLQSGSGRILRLMERPYSPEEYRRAVEEIVRRAPGVALGCDIMAGFPGETEDDFAQSAAMLEELPFSYAHVFPYSPRPATKASAMEDTVPDGEKRRRVAALKEIAGRKNLAFRQKLVGASEQVLVERKAWDGGILTGKTGTFIQASFSGPATMRGELATVRVERVTADGVWAVPA